MNYIFTVLYGVKQFTSAHRLIDIQSRIRTAIVETKMRNLVLIVLLFPSFLYSRPFLFLLWNVFTRNQGRNIFRLFFLDDFTCFEMVAIF